VPQASLLLNMYKTSSKLTRDMREVVESEKKLQAEVEELREKVRELSELQAKAAEGAAPEFKSEKGVFLLNMTCALLLVAASRLC
jgi:FtsZ-binding cell division protein ZapB